MFASLIQALGVDGTFFVQFIIFLLFYPVLSRFLLRPYFQLQNQREKETVGCMKQAEKLKEKQLSLKEQYERKARDINEQFNKLYGEESKKLRELFLQRRMKNQEEIQKEYEQEKEGFFQEVEIAKNRLQSEVNELTGEAVERLIS